MTHVVSSAGAVMMESNNAGKRDMSDFVVSESLIGGGISLSSPLNTLYLRSL